MEENIFSIEKTYGEFQSRTLTSGKKIGVGCNERQVFYEIRTSKPLPIEFDNELMKLVNKFNQ